MLNQDEAPISPAHASVAAGETTARRPSRCAGLTDGSARTRSAASVRGSREPSTSPSASRRNLRASAVCLSPGATVRARARRRSVCTSRCETTRKSPGAGPPRAAARAGLRLRLARALNALMGRRSRVTAPLPCTTAEERAGRSMPCATCSKTTRSAAQAGRTATRVDRFASSSLSAALEPRSSRTLRPRAHAFSGRTGTAGPSVLGADPKWPAAPPALAEPDLVSSQRLPQSARRPAPLRGVRPPATHGMRRVFRTDSTSPTRLAVTSPSTGVDGTQCAGRTNTLGRALSRTCPARRPTRPTQPPPPSAALMRFFRANCRGGGEPPWGSGSRTSSPPSYVASHFGTG